jgi:hypothetical protein
MAARRAAQAAATKRDRIMPAPADEPKIEVLTGTETTEKKTPTMHTDESVLAEDFKALEDGAFGGEGKDTLADMQKGFAIDLKNKQAEVDDWNKQTIPVFDEKKQQDNIATTSSWLDILDNGKSYELPFPGDQVWYPDTVAKMRLRFDQTDFGTRQSHLTTNQRELGLALTFDLETKTWADRYQEIALGRKDAHIIVHSVKLCKRNTKGLPFSCEVKFYTGTNEAERLRIWHTDDAEGHTAGTLGLVTNAVVEPDENSRDAPMLIYHASMEHLTNPWMSRFMTFNFDKFRELLSGEVYRHPKNENYYKIKAPPTAASFNFKEVTPVQWLVFSFFRYLKWATKRAMATETDASFAEKVGTSVIQSLPDKGGYQFVIHKPALNRVIAALQQKVRPATHMANLEHVVLGLSFVGGTDTAVRLDERAAMMSSLRDDLERDPIVGPMNFVVEIGYIAIPKDYPQLEMQTEGSTGGKFHPYKKATSKGYGSHSYAQAARS